MQAPLFGVGFRTQHAAEIAAAPGPVDWFEVLADPYLGVGGRRRALLERLRAAHPLALHGVSLSIAGSEPLDRAYLDGLAALAAWLEPVFVSDHLCWTALGGHQSHDLLPVAYTQEVLAHVAARVAHVQERLGRRILLENASAYVAFRAREMDEADFFAELVRRTGCGVLLDVNNLVVNAANLGSDPKRALDALPADAVGYLHLAGHAVLPDVRIDTHGAAVPGAVWTLFEATVRRFPTAGVIIERDDDLPAYAALAAEAEEARASHAAALATPAERPPAGRPPAGRPQAERPQSGRPQAGRSPARSEPTRGSASREASGVIQAEARSEPTRGSASREASEVRPWPALQHALFARIVDQPLGHEHANLAGLLDESLPVRAARGLRVYSDAYAASLRSALAAHFGALARVLAPADFDRLAAAYLRAHPPRGFDYVGLGARFAEFVAGFDFAAGYGVPRAVLAELAALEQAQLEAQDAPDAAHPVGPAELAALAAEDWERARFVFTPAFRVVRATHDVAPVIEAAAAGRDPARPAPGAVAYLVCRAGEGVRTERLAPREAAVLEALLAGRTLHAACAGDEAAALDAARRLVEAARAGLVAGLERATEV